MPKFLHQMTSLIYLFISVKFKIILFKNLITVIVHLLCLYNKTILPMRYLRGRDIHSCRFRLISVHNSKFTIYGTNLVLLVNIRMN